MARAIYDFISIVVVVILGIFAKRVMRRLGLNPKRLRDLFGYFSTISVLITLERFIVTGVSPKAVKLLLVGAVVGIPVTILTNKRVFVNIRDPRPGDKATLICTSLIAITVGAWAAYAGLYREVITFLWGIFLTNVIGVFIDALKYERKHGPLYLRNRSGGGQGLNLDVNGTNPG